MGNQTSAASSSSSASTSYRNFDVFINHRGPDVKDTFAAHLYRRLIHHGLQVFLDKPEMVAGEGITDQIEAAIQVSSVHVAIFSPKYAESKWCLDELTLMVESREKAKSRVTIFPVFYKVKPSDLRSTAGSYAKAFIDHEKKARDQSSTIQKWISALSYAAGISGFQSSTIQKWRSALLYAAGLSGFELNGDDEEELLNKVVQAVLKKFPAQAVLKKVPKPALEVAKYPTGVDDKLQDFERTMLQWHEQQVKVKVVGIVGLGGIGKTTLAKAFFNRKRSDYHESCFLFEVRETSIRKSVSYLQTKLIEDLKHRKDIIIDSPEQGIGILKEHLSDCHALIIIDDVDRADQMDGLLPMKDILHPESLILVTTRDEHVLKESGVPLIYNLTGLNPSYSRELFCSYAFFQPLPPPEFEELVDRFVTACGGLPLSLKVIGALLCGENEIYWEEQFDLLRESLPRDILKRLRISYDSLTGKDQEIFLDIACFFLGEDRDRAVRIWGHVGIRNLENKCLLEVDSGNKIRMHDHIRDSARNIAKEKCMPPRLWHGTTDNIDALLELSPSAITEVRGITTVGDIDPWPKTNLHREILHPTSVNNYISEMFKKQSVNICKMSNLQLVATEGSYLEGILRMVRSPPIKWLRWMGCSESSLPDWIPMKNLKVLELHGDMLEFLWPHHSQGPLGLLELNIVAPRLKEFPKSIGKLKHLQWISVNDEDTLQDYEWSGKIETLPQEFCELCSLKHLVLKRFTGLMSLPDLFGKLTNLEYLDLGGASSLQTLPNSFGDLIRLKQLSLKWCSSLTISKGALGNITTLEYLDLKGCRNVKELPPQVLHQRFLEILNLTGTNLKELPSDIGDLRSLEDLEIGNHSLEVLPPSFGCLERLKYFKAYNLPKLKCLPDSFGQLTQLTELALRQCGIEYLPEDLLKLNNLESLCVICPLQQLSFKAVEGEADKCMFGLTKLQLGSTKISEVTFPEGVCPNLQHLELRNNVELMQIRGLCGLSKLDDFQVYHSPKLKSIQSLAQLTKLDTLVVVGCDEIGLEGVEHCLSLTSLEVSCCPKLKSMPWLAQFTKLRSLNVGGCREIVGLPGVEHCMSLRYLDASECPKLKSMPWLGQLTKLRWLVVRRCHEIVGLPGVEDCMSLEDLDARECPNLQWGEGVLQQLRRRRVNVCWTL